LAACPLRLYRIPYRVTIVVIRLRIKGVDGEVDADAEVEYEQEGEEQGEETVFVY
jgi:hypothetical protein